MFDTREKFILIIQTGAIVRDIKLDKAISEDLVICAIEIPDELLDFEYGIY